MDELERFRQDTRAWLEANCPAEMREPVRGDEDICWGGRNWVFQSSAQKLWLERMAARGWTVPAWPKSYGGGGLDHEQVKVLKDEMARIGARSPLESFGIWMLGPALLAFGSEEQKLEHLPPIARGEIRWCQGYSEPNAGSDLASLMTRAEDKGDHFEVTGQKIWTSYADKADKIFCLVRTNMTAPKHLGISFLLFDMTSPGVTTRPILLISGKSPFCETFFDAVKVPKGNVVGTLDRGWDVAKHLLTHERSMIGEGGGGLLGGRSPGQVAAQEVGVDAAGKLADGFLRVDAARNEVDALAFALTMERYKDEAAASGGKGVGDKSSVLKYYGTELNKRRHELLMRTGGSEALEWEGGASNDGQRPRDWLRTKANSIEGGTSEVMLEIVAKRLLGLPAA
ncbi:MAG: acyl-CoA dehydrogenase family protein [Alphaproteobacteria bacterium]